MVAGEEGDPWPRDTRRDLQAVGRSEGVIIVIIIIITKQTL